VTAPYPARVVCAAEILGMTAEDLTTRLAGEPEDEWLPPDEAAALMGISQTALARRRQRGTSPEYKTRGERTYRYSKRAILKEVSHDRN